MRSMLKANTNPSRALRLEVFVLRTLILVSNIPLSGRYSAHSVREGWRREGKGKGSKEKKTRRSWHQVDACWQDSRLLFGPGPQTGQWGGVHYILSELMNKCTCLTPHERHLQRVQPWAYRSIMMPSCSWWASRTLCTPHVACATKRVRTRAHTTHPPPHPHTILGFSASVPIDTLAACSCRHRDAAPKA